MTRRLDGSRPGTGIGLGDDMIEVTATGDELPQPHATTTARSLVIAVRTPMRCVRLPDLAPNRAPNDDRRSKASTTNRLRGIDAVILTIYLGTFSHAPRAELLLLESALMSEGTIKRLTDKGFGFIANASGTDMFFHMSAVEGVRFEDLREGQKVSYNEGRGPKGPRAENVRVL
jgi:CspA family cold shock protein